MREKFTKKRIVLLSILSLFVVIFGSLLFVSTSTYRVQESDEQELLDYVRAYEEQPDGEGKQTKGISADLADSMLFEIDWNALYQINPDIVAWIIVPDTQINYPVVQTTDNDYYVNHSFKKEKLSSGAIFIDCENHADFSDFNTILYGHNMRNGSMFATLNQYADEAFYKAHPDVWICTPLWQRKYRILSAHVAIAGKETYDIPATFSDFQSYLDREMQNSLYTCGENQEYLPVVALSTCRKHNSQERMVLICQPEFQINEVNNN